jgi:hypothetical protein
VPDHLDVYDSTPVISYADYRAIEAGRGIQTPTVQDFLDKTDASALWIAASTGLVSGPDFVRNVFTGLERTPDLLGFSFFDIDRALTFGTPPGTGAILAGKFNPARIAQAYNAASRRLTWTACPWCGSDGCESGWRLAR